MDSSPRRNGKKQRNVAGRALTRDLSNQRVIERLLIYEQWIESSMFRTMREPNNLRNARKDGHAGTAFGGKSEIRNSRSETRVAQDRKSDPLGGKLKKRKPICSKIGARI